MNARVDAAGNQVSEGAQVEIGHHYISLSRREFGLDRVSPIGYEVPRGEAVVDGIVYGEPSESSAPRPNTAPPERSAVEALAEAESQLGVLPTDRA